MVTWRVEKAKKDNSEFRFEHTIYADLFLHKNEENAKKVSQRIKSLRT